MQGFLPVAVSVLAASSGSSVEVHVATVRLYRAVASGVAGMACMLWFALLPGFVSVGHL